LNLRRHWSEVDQWIDATVRELAALSLINAELISNAVPELSAEDFDRAIPPAFYLGPLPAGW
jgi:hypothetical protein